MKKPMNIQLFADPAPAPQPAPAPAPAPTLTPTPAPEPKPQPASAHREGFIPRHRFDRVKEERDKLRKEILAIKQSGGDGKWKEKYEALLAENAAKAAEAEEAKRHDKIVKCLEDAYDPDLVYGMLKQDKITVEGEEVKGIAEQVKELKKAKPFLFKPVGQIAKPAPGAKKIETSFGKELAKQIAPKPVQKSSYF